MQNLRQISLLKLFCAEFEANIRCNAMTLDEIMLKALQNPRFSAFGFGEWQLSSDNFAERAARFIDSNSSLLIGNEMKDELKTFLCSLGSSDADSQINICRTYFDKFDDFERESRENAKQSRKLYATLGILGAAFTAVVLI